MFARVARYETTDSARLEVDRATYVLQADSRGRVVVSHLVLGREVEAGDVLVELDANPARLELAEQVARRGVLDPEVESLRAELSATVQAREREQEANLAAIEEARARIVEAEPVRSSPRQKPAEPSSCSMRVSPPNATTPARNPKRVRPAPRWKPFGRY